MKEEKVAAIRKFNLEGVLENTDKTPLADGVEVKLTDRSTTVSRMEDTSIYHVGDIVTLCDNEYTRSNYGGFVGELFCVEVINGYQNRIHTLHHIETILRLIVAPENIKMIDAFSSYSIIDRSFPTNTQEEIDLLFKNFGEFLKEKNKRYGDSAINPLNIFSKEKARSIIVSRIDEKLSRIKNSSSLKKNDISDLFGYLALFMIENNWISFEEFID